MIINSLCFESFRRTHVKYIRDASLSDADFTFIFLIDYYDDHRTEIDAASYIYRDEDKNGSRRRDVHYQEDMIYFRFEGSNTLYNLYDAGNFMWGAWSAEVNISDSESEWGPELNELFRDSDADGRAIQSGRSWYNNKK